ncbi:MAG: hypothetical protein V8R63_01165 [Thomasclavelia ramosa]
MEIVSDLRTIFKLLLVMSVEEVLSSYPHLSGYFRDRDEFVKVIEEVYLSGENYNVIVLYIMKIQVEDIKMFSSEMLKLSLKN